jgi:hypothetical protein
MVPRLTKKKPIEVKTVRVERATVRDEVSSSTDALVHRFAAASGRRVVQDRHGRELQHHEAIADGERRGRSLGLRDRAVDRQRELHAVAPGLGADTKTIGFARQTARYILIKQIGSGSDHWRSISELTVYQ